MATEFAAVRARLAEKSVIGEYRAFLLAGAVFTVAGLAVFAVALMGSGSHRAWQAFHVNWLFWTILTAAPSLTRRTRSRHAKWSESSFASSQAPSP